MDGKFISIVAITAIAVIAIGGGVETLLVNNGWSTDAIENLPELETLMKKENIAIAVSLAGTLLLALWFIVHVIREKKQESEEPIVLEYDLDGGINNIENPVNFIHDGFVLKDPVKDNHVFEGWYSEPGFTERVTTPKRTEASVKLYAKWKPAEYRVSYDLGGMDAVNTNPETVEANDMLILEPLSKEGWEFVGWYTDSGFSPESRVKTLFPESDVTLYARWERIPVTIRLDRGDGKADGIAVVRQLSESATVKKMPSKKYCTAEGFYTSPGGTKVLNGDGSFASSDVEGFIENGKWTGAEDCTLFTRWLWSITLSKGEGDANGSATVDDGETCVTITAPSIRNGYALTGYFASHAGDNKVLNADGSFAAETVPNYIEGGKWIRKTSTVLYALV